MAQTVKSLLREDNGPFVLHSHYHGWWWPGPWFNIKMSSYRYRKYHCGDKTVVRSSYLHNGISYTGKMASLYWIRAQTTQWARTSAVITSNWFSQNIPLLVWQLICRSGAISMHRFPIFQEVTMTWSRWESTSLVVPIWLPRWTVKLLTQTTNH